MPLRLISRALSEAQYKNQMAQAVKTSAETNGIRISNRIAEQTADSLIYANIQANRARGLSSLWESKNTNVLKNIEYSKDKALIVTGKQIGRAHV